MLEHGGRRRAAAQRYGIPERDWLDLSTGIHPFAYPIPAIPNEVWQRLPEDDDSLLAAASEYYGTPQLLALAGSQQAIQGLPRLLPARRVAVLQPIYAEHAAHWNAAGHSLSRFAADSLEAAATAADVVVVCNPNNPDGGVFCRQRLLAAAATLARRGGCLIVDEAFVDPTPEASVVALAGSDAHPNLIVLRSLGKFFGLAGARVGFLAGPAELRAALREAAGPWPLANPARWVAQAALRDRAWQGQTRQWLASAGQRLRALVEPLAEAPGSVVGTAVVGTALFVWLPTSRAPHLAAALARQAVLVREFADDVSGLRFGLPGPEEDWQRLAEALVKVRACAL
jgi:cobalamin biosynthesis protein CobC